LGAIGIFLAGDGTAAIIGQVIYAGICYQIVELEPCKFSHPQKTM